MKPNISGENTYFMDSTFVVNQGNNRDRNNFEGNSLKLVDTRLPRLPIPFSSFLLKLSPASSFHTPPLPIPTIHLHLPTPLPPTSTPLTLLHPISHLPTALPHPSASRLLPIHESPPPPTPPQPSLISHPYPHFPPPPSPPSPTHTPPPPCYTLSPQIL